MDIFSLWSKALEVIKVQDPQYYEPITKGIFPKTWEQGIFTIILTTSDQPWILGWFKAVYQKKLESIITSLIGQPTTIQVISDDKKEECLEKSDSPIKENTTSAPFPEKTTDFVSQEKVPDFMKTVTSGEYNHVPLPSIHDKIKNKSTLSSDNLFDNQTKATESEILSEQVTIDPQFTFDTFIHGPSNELAFRAARSVAEAAVLGKTDRRTNPLFIYGPSGLGKTHLLHAICNYIHEQAPALNVLFVTSETFLNHLIRSIETSSMEQFRRRYRHVDYFLMDDVQLFSGKNSSQVEVFNTFNVLFDNKKHIILTSDRTPQDIEKLEDRIKTRFSSGLIAPIEPPDYEMCSVILLKKAENDNILLPEEVVNYIAGHIHTNVRELNGAYNKLVSNAILTKQEITLENTKELLRDIIPFDKKKELNMDFITDVVCQYYGISKSSVLSKSRPKKIVTPRQMAMYFCRQELNESYPNIRDFFKRKDHTTVMYACERVDEDLKTKPAIKEDYDKIKKILESR